MNGVTDLKNERKNHTTFKRRSDMCKGLVMSWEGFDKHMVDCPEM